MWGLDPTDSAIETVELFLAKGLKKILIPGFGYGRNAKVFTNNGFNVTGIEISETAIAISRQYFSDKIKVYHGSVCDMPFDQVQYDGIFCYALIHLLNSRERIKLIKDCYNQLKADGYMVFVAISTSASTYGIGEQLSKNRFKTNHGVRLFFYDLTSIEKEFGKYGFMEAKEITETTKNMQTSASLIFWQIICKRN